MSQIVDDVDAGQNDAGHGVTSRNADGEAAARQAAAPWNAAGQNAAQHDAGQPDAGQENAAQHENAARHKNDVHQENAVQHKNAVQQENDVQQETAPQEAARQARLGERIRRERADRGWSLTQLAEASGVSRAMINRIERGASSPTATILGRLSGALGLTISQLLAIVEAEGPQVERAATADRWRDPDTGYERRQLAGPSFPADVTEVRLPAGQQVTYPASAYAFLRHLIWVVDGTLELVHGGDPTRLGVGDRIELGEPAEVTYRNPTDSDCRYVVVVLRRP